MTIICNIRNNGILIVFLHWFAIEIKRTSASMWTRTFEDLFRYDSFIMKSNLTNRTFSGYNSSVEDARQRINYLILDNSSGLDNNHAPFTLCFSNLKTNNQSSFSFNVGSPNFDPRNPTWYLNGGVPDDSDRSRGKSTAHKIVHLNSRPTQVYYQSIVTFANESSDNNQQLICEARVSIDDIYITIDDSNKAYVDIFFYCSGWCCGIDCCQLSITFIFAVCCVGVVIFVIIGNICMRTICKRLLTIRAMRRISRLGAKRRKRHIVRANAQRRHVAGDDIEDHHELPPSKPTRITQRNRMVVASRRVQVKKPLTDESNKRANVGEPLIPQSQTENSPPLVMKSCDENNYIEASKINVEDKI